MSAKFTNLALPSDLLEAVDSLIQEGVTPSRDEFVVSALRHELTEVRRSALDAEFRHMAGDVEYQQELHQILAEFARAR